MTVEDAEHVRSQTVDGSRWHVVVDRHETDEDVLETACGRTVPIWRSDDYSPEGDRPDGLSGNTICYGCTRSLNRPTGNGGETA